VFRWNSSGFTEPLPGGLTKLFSITAPYGECFAVDLRDSPAEQFFGVFGAENGLGQAPTCAFFMTRFFTKRRNLIFLRPRDPLFRCATYFDANVIFFHRHLCSPRLPPAQGLFTFFLCTDWRSLLKICVDYSSPSWTSTPLAASYVSKAVPGMSNSLSLAPDPPRPCFFRPRNRPLWPFPFLCDILHSPGGALRVLFLFRAVLIEFSPPFATVLDTRPGKLLFLVGWLSCAQYLSRTGLYCQVFSPTPTQFFLPSDVMGPIIGFVSRKNYFSVTYRELAPIQLGATLFFSFFFGVRDLPSRCLRAEYGFLSALLARSSRIAGRSVSPSRLPYRFEFLPATPDCKSKNSQKGDRCLLSFPVYALLFPFIRLVFRTSSSFFSPFPTFFVLSFRQFRGHHFALASGFLKIRFNSARQSLLFSVLPPTPLPLLLIRPQGLAGPRSGEHVVLRFIFAPVA